MSNAEYGNPAEKESQKLELQNGMQADFERMRATSYTAEQLDHIEENSTALRNTIESI